MLRIHFTPADLARVRVARTPDPLWETLLGLQQFIGRDRTPLVYARWRNQARTEITRRGLAPMARLLAMLAPPGAPYFPDFLNPVEAADGIAEGIGALRRTPRGRLRAETAVLARTCPPPAAAAGWLRGLALGEQDRLDEIADAFRGLHDAVIAPDWTGVAKGVAADRSDRARAVFDGGAHELLRALKPVGRWEPPVLHLTYPEDRDLHLHGRGLYLIPSWFCWRTPVAMADADLPPVLVHPIEHTLCAGPGVGRAHHADALARLLGATRARALGALLAPATNGELACRLETSAASASKHAKALREAGLVVSRREGGNVIHAVTPLGAAILDGALPLAAR
ncbi:transcriptional regulator [Streptomyces sp. NBC_00448]|uniref:transcriptional regulator n=1 Tax=Streptomyces sp. NBC_00448 TaxID=2903652 RepID=UPI002E1D6FBE